MSYKNASNNYEQIEVKDVKNWQIQVVIFREKEIGALQIAEDAIYVDTTNLSIEEVKEKVKEIIENKRGK